MFSSKNLYSQIGTFVVQWEPFSSRRNLCSTRTGLPKCISTQRSSTGRSRWVLARNHASRFTRGIVTGVRARPNQSRAASSAPADSQLMLHTERQNQQLLERARFPTCLLINRSNMAAIRLFRQGVIRVLMAGRTGRLSALSSLMGNLAACDGDVPLFPAPDSTCNWQSALLF